MKITRFIDPSARIGACTDIWHYAVVLAGVSIGRDCSIGAGTEIGCYCTIGNRTRIGAHCFLPPRTQVGSEVFISPGVVMCDDKHPRVLNSDYDAKPPVIEDYAVIGAGAVILPGVRIGKGALVGAGAVVTRNVGPGRKVKGVPARLFR